MGSVAERNGVAHDCLAAREPGWAKEGSVYVLLRGFIEQCCTNQLGFCAESLGSACLYNLLILLCAESELPGNPLNRAMRFEPLVDKAEQADAGHAIGIEMLGCVCVAKLLNHALHSFIIQAGCKHLELGFARVPNCQKRIPVQLCLPPL